MKDSKRHLDSEALGFKQRHAATRVRGGRIFEGTDYEYHLRPGGSTIQVTKNNEYGRMVGGELDLYVEFNPDGTVKEMFELGNPPLGWKTSKPDMEPDERGR